MLTLQKKNFSSSNFLGFEKLNFENCLILSSDLNFLTQKTYILIYMTTFRLLLARVRARACKQSRALQFELGFEFLDPKNLYFDVYDYFKAFIAARVCACAQTVARTLILSSDLDSLTQKTYILIYMTTLRLLLVRVRARARKLLRAL